MISEAQLPLDR